MCSVRVLVRTDEAVLANHKADYSLNIVHRQVFAQKVSYRVVLVH